MAGPIYVINGFYMSMREKYTAPGKSIYWMSVEWESKSSAWEAFRGTILGATDPTTAEKGALRRQILDDWKALGLATEPNVGDNGVHASASPFEAMCERMNWLEAKLEDDVFGKALLAAGVEKKTIMSWTKDPQVELPEGGKGSLFDALEDMDADKCIEKACKIAKVEYKAAETKPVNAAFVFIKPHAVNDKVVALVKDGFSKAGIKVLKEGKLASETIEKKLLIDNHYYAIANKASLTLPKDLNPPAAKKEDFAKLFGFTWAEALEKGIVFNAVDGCKKLGINGSEMNTKWAASKKGKAMIKFGGGFYCGKIE